MGHTGCSQWWTGVMSNVFCFCFVLVFLVVLLVDLSKNYLSDWRCCVGAQDVVQYSILSVASFALEWVLF